MDDEAARCQCRRWRVPCKTPMTQEDLLCDACRAAACSMFAWGPVGCAPEELPNVIHCQMGPVELKFAGGA